MIGKNKTSTLNIATITVAGPDHLTKQSDLGWRVGAKIIETLYGLETQHKLLFNAQHGYVIICNY